MSFTVDQIVHKIDKPFLYVDYNELIEEDIIMLSKIDIKNDYFGVPVSLCEGLEVVGFQKDENIDGTRDDIIVEGVCTLNKTGYFNHVKWVLKIDDKGIRYISDILEKGG